MKLCRFVPLESAASLSRQSAREAHAHSQAGILEGDTIREISGALWGPRQPTGREFRVKDVKFLPPSDPSKIVCVGRNYLEHISEMASVAPKEPLIFLKPPSAIIPPEGVIVLPPSSHRVDYEGEIAVVIGRRASRLGPNDDP